MGAATIKPNHMKCFLPSLSSALVHWLSMLALYNTENEPKLINNKFVDVHSQIHFMQLCAYRNASLNKLIGAFATFYTVKLK